MPYVCQTRGMNLQEFLRPLDPKSCSLFLIRRDLSSLIWRTMENVRPCSLCGSLAERNALLPLRRRCATTGFSGGKIKHTTVRIFFLSFLSMYFYVFLLHNWEMEKNFIVVSFPRLPTLKIILITAVASLRLLITVTPHDRIE